MVTAVLLLPRWAGGWRPLKAGCPMDLWLGPSGTKPGRGTEQHPPAGQRGGSTGEACKGQRVLERDLKRVCNFGLFKISHR